MDFVFISGEIKTKIIMFICPHGSNFASLLQLNLLLCLVYFRAYFNDMYVLDDCTYFYWTFITPFSLLASFAEEVNSRLAKCPLVFNGRLANCGLTSLVKEATGLKFTRLKI